MKIDAYTTYDDLLHAYAAAEDESERSEILALITADESDEDAIFELECLFFKHLESVEREQHMKTITVDDLERWGACEAGLSYFHAHYPDGLPLSPDTNWLAMFRQVPMYVNWLHKKITGVSLDLRGADLRGADLSGVDLYGADLFDADLRDADLTGARGYTQGGAT